MAESCPKCWKRCAHPSVGWQVIRTWILRALRAWGTSGKWNSVLLYFSLKDFSKENQEFETWKGHLFRQNHQKEITELDRFRWKCFLFQKSFLTFEKFMRAVSNWKIRSNSITSFQKTFLIQKSFLIIQFPFKNRF